MHFGFHFGLWVGWVATIRKQNPVIKTIVIQPPRGSMERLGRPGERAKGLRHQTGWGPKASSLLRGTPALPVLPQPLHLYGCQGLVHIPPNPPTQHSSSHKHCILCCEDLLPEAAHPFPPRMDPQGDAELHPCGGGGRGGRAVISEMTRGPTESPGRSTGFQSRLCPDIHGGPGKSGPLSASLSLSLKCR